MADFPRRDEKGVLEIGLPVIPEEKEVPPSIVQECAETTQEEEAKTLVGRSRLFDGQNLESLLLPDEEGAVSLQYATTADPLTAEENLVQAPPGASIADSSSSSDLGTVSMFWSEKTKPARVRSANVPEADKELVVSFKPKTANERSNDDVPSPQEPVAEAGPSRPDDGSSSPGSSEDLSPENRVILACMLIKRACEAMSNDLGVIRIVYDKIQFRDYKKYVKWHGRTSPTQLGSAVYDIIKKLPLIEEALNNVPFSSSIYNNRKREITARCFSVKRKCAFLLEEFSNLHSSLTYEFDIESLRLKDQLKLACGFLKRTQKAFNSGLRKIEAAVLEETVQQQQLQPLAVNLNQFLNVQNLEADGESVQDIEEDFRGIIGRLRRSMRVNCLACLSFFALGGFIVGCCVIYIKTYFKDARIPIEGVKPRPKSNVTSLIDLLTQ
ncbi:hypothetical protein C0J52_08519 [Blattella germanica]|nr:hypothetical protein C0J52_08519 [Blattella germanica]